MAGKPAPPAAAAADAVEAPKSGKLLLVLPLVAAILGVGLGATQSGRLAGVLPGTHAPAAASEGPDGEEAEAAPAHEAAYLDQRWCDLVPGLFDRVAIERCPPPGLTLAFDRAAA